MLDTFNFLTSRYDLQNISIKDINLNWMPVYFVDDCNEEGIIIFNHYYILLNSGNLKEFKSC